MILRLTLYQIIYVSYQNISISQKCYLSNYPMKGDETFSFINAD